MDKMLENMRRETTMQAKKCIQSHSELKRIHQSIKDSSSDNKMVELENECTEWANNHDGMFGNIFVTELPLVHWDKLVHENI